MQNTEEGLLSAHALPAPEALPVPVSLTRGKRDASLSGDKKAAESRAKDASDSPASSWNWNPYNLVALDKPEECLSIGAAFTETCLSFALDGRLTPQQILFLEQTFKRVMATSLTDCVRASSTAAPGLLRRGPGAAKKLAPVGNAWTLKGTCLSFKREGDATRMILEDASLNIKGLFLPCKRLCLVDLAGQQTKKRRLL
ncbi:hypothetical protein TGDOM2_231020 [Toxoplasma gondii GAB2-2007-GAL-DOM2]|uniref:Uncharacterized protein n=6 Tax=Toxoplasma gondii TaxID=5811 RepID=S7WIG9_TOXGG|nr:hypothetical protein TGGT1_231020 [Toxoplasma gondii GT1]KAF4641723.1 hypothetical protein TGRH88_075340 [Toxoplasma gondii]KFG48441.1 hypothetical protein TGDOM2_231020 [Toxoplasma gondii GAB2-2007-GAL-DOM2]KFG55446.1 hypothetical protein TGFOU_231020 [Toxoplasma gondii FOU]PUA92778.1 hypothetical protein TGBR9_231020 [Toxoplasma gondii TgCATBr9]RQX75903.1 hypothetical protein TGCAST_231020 [Toxoplasma gondii CAST]